MALRVYGAHSMSTANLTDWGKWWLVTQRRKLMIQIKITKWGSIASSETSTDWTPGMIVSFSSLLFRTPMAKCRWMKRAFHTPGWRLPIMTETRWTLIFHVNQEDMYHVHVRQKYPPACSCSERSVPPSVENSFVRLLYWQIYSFVFQGQHRFACRLRTNNIWAPIIWRSKWS